MLMASGRPQEIGQYHVEHVDTGRSKIRFFCGHHKCMIAYWASLQYTDYVSIHRDFNDERVLKCMGNLCSSFL